MLWLSLLVLCGVLMSKPCCATLTVCALQSGVGLYVNSVELGTIETLAGFRPLGPVFFLYSNAYLHHCFFFFFSPFFFFSFHFRLL